MRNLSDLTSELREQYVKFLSRLSVYFIQMDLLLPSSSGQIAACLETLPKISSSLEECHAIARGRKVNSLSDNYTIKSRILADEVQKEKNESLSPEGSTNKV